MERKALFFDIDGTLMELTPPTDRTLKAIENVRKNGHFAFICTGRSEGYVPDFIKSIPLDGAIYGAGSAVFLNGKPLSHRFLSKELFQRTFDVLNEYHISGFWECEDRDPLHKNGGLCAFGRRPQSEYFRAYPFVCSSQEFFQRFPNETVTKLSVHSEIPLAAATLLKKDFHFISHTPQITELVLPGVSKAAGIGIMLRHLGLTAADAIAFGDSMNDYEMIKYAGCGVAMGNACDALKAVANEITLPCSEDGVAVFLEERLL